MFHGHGARVKEDHEYDGPKPPLHLAQLSNGDPSSSKASSPFALGT